MRFLASQAADATAGHLVGSDAELDGASFDSRSLRPGQLFVPLVATRDGHEFISAALAAGAGAYLTARTREGGTAIEVGNTADALMSLASWARGRMAATVVGVTGSVGKTTTKDFIAAAVGTERRVAANVRSYNNEQGLPVTILGAPDDTEVLVLEMGMRGFGEIARLCDVGRPRIGIVTSAGSSHTARLGGIDGVARAKRELVEALPPRGTAVLNADDERVVAMAAASVADVVTFGCAPGADVRIHELRLDRLARPRFTLSSPWGTVEVQLATTGRHMASNAAGALAVAGALGVDLGAAAIALARAETSASRMQICRSPAGGIVINDAYNANPTSMRAALEALAAVEATRRIAVLGMMAELDDAVEAHEAVAMLAAELGIELVAVGTDLYGIAPVVDPVAAVGVVERSTAVLVKASRVAGLERVAALLAGDVG